MTKDGAEKKKKYFKERKWGRVMKLGIPKYETSLELLPKYSTPHESKVLYIMKNVGEISWQ